MSCPGPHRRITPSAVTMSTLAELVAGQTIGSAEHADPAAQGEACDADGRARTAWEQEALRAELAVHVDQHGSCTDADGLLP